MVSKIVFYCLLALFLFFLIYAVIGTIQENKILRNLYSYPLWDMFIAESKKFKFKYVYHYNSNNQYVYHWEYGNYDVVVWVDDTETPTPTCSIHTMKTDCVLSNFNKVKSNELAMILLNSIGWNNNNEYFCEHNHLA